MTAPRAGERVLAADVGGTKAALALFDTAGHGPVAVREAVLECARFTCLEELIRPFLAEAGAGVRRAVLSVAGPVVGGRASLVNLPWQIDEAQLAADLGLEQVRLINDLQALAHALPGLSGDDLHTLQPGAPEADGVRAVVAPGTGLGEAMLLHEGGRWIALPSEGGHGDFAPTDEQQLALLRHLLPEFPHVSYERVCSGRGIPNLYAFLRATGMEEPAWLRERLQGADDPAPAIVEAALEPGGGCDICVETVRLFARILAAEAGNMALRAMATGGVFLGGGIPPRILPFLEEPAFLETFRAKGRLSELAARTPLHVVLNARAPLMGAARYAAELPRG